MNPTREVYWNISHAWALYLLFVPALFAFAYGMYRHYRLWCIGRSVGPIGFHGQRLQRLLLTGFGHRRILSSPYAGIFHALFFSGFAVLFLGTLVVWIHQDFGLHIMQGAFYLYFQSFGLDVFGLLAIVGLLMAVLRRALFKPKRLNSTWQDATIEALLLTILVTGFVLEGIRLVATGDPWAAWSPVGLAAGRILAVVLPEWSLQPTHIWLWWFHLALVCGLIAWLPHSKLLHVVTAAANLYLRPLAAKGAMLQPLDLEKAEAFGVDRLDQFTWKDLLDLDACTECGRCQDACPAYATGKPLSPKSLILDLRGAMRGGDAGAALVGNVIKEETLWACTNCMACMEVCPVSIAHVPKIVDMRRHLVMEEGRAPEPMQQAMRNLEARGHPFPGAAASRLDWCRDLGVKVLSEGQSSEYLYWVGCATALNPRNQKTAQAFSRLMQEAGVDFAILGNDEACNGDAARRMGNEYLFQSMVQRNLDVLRSRNVKKIVTTCPHCFNTFKNEYPQFGGEFEVYHHSQFLSRLITKGRLKSPDGAAGTVTFHDPCHLGRYNEVYDEPRDVIESVSGAELIEMAQSRQSSFCCGGGGGRTWVEEPAGQRVGNVRAREALETRSQTLGVACPFCMLMLEEGVKSEAGGRDMKVLDIAEILQGAGKGSALTQMSKGLET